MHKSYQLVAGSRPLAKIDATNRITDTDAVCSFCGEAAETELDQLWECPANLVIDTEAVQNTQRYAREAIEGSVSNPTYWLRGILHYGMIELSPVFTDYRLALSFGAQAEWGSGTCFGDGSGGQYTSFPDFRYCDLGICYFVTGPEALVAAAGTPLPGKVQTVPRAEVFAIYLMFRKVISSAIVRYTGSSLHVIQLANDPAAAKRSYHSHLFDVFSEFRLPKRSQQSLYACQATQPSMPRSWRLCPAGSRIGMCKATVKQTKRRSRQHGAVNLT